MIREAGGDHSGVTGGTRVLSDRIVVQVTAEPGQSFLDRMIALVEGAIRQKTPNEIALTIVLAAFSLIFLIVTATLYPMARYFDLTLDIPTLVALLVCLIPTTIGALLAAIGIAGMDRALAANIIAKSGKAVEVAGDIDTLLLDKTGTITIGNRRATQFVPLGGASARDVARLAGLASLADQTPEGKSILDLARQQAAVDGEAPAGARVHRVHRPDPHERHRPARRPRASARGRPTPSPATSQDQGGHVPDGYQETGRRDRLAGARRRWPSPRATGSSAWSSWRTSSSPASASGSPGCGRWACASVMVTGDNPLTAKAIAEQAGVDDYIAQATPEAKLAYIRKEQDGGKLVAMMGDGTNDAPALAQADIGVAMNSRHPGRQGGRQHGRPRQRPDQAHRGRRDRQAAPDDPRRADHVLDRQRPGQVLRRHPGAVRRDAAGAEGPRPDGPGDAGRGLLGDPRRR